MTALARLDLEEILGFLAFHRGPERAASVIGELLAASERLAEMPGIGHPRPDLTEESVRFWPVHGYLIAYEPGSRPLVIHRVVHGARDPDWLREQLAGD